MFDAPLAGTGDVCKPVDIVGHLLIIVTKELLPQYETTYGKKDTVVVDVADLDTGTISLNAKWFNKALAGSLAPKVGGAAVLARMGEGVAKPGQKPPYILIDATTDAAAVAKAEAFQADHPEFNPQSGAATQPSPAPAPAPAGQLDLSTLPPEVQALLAKQQATA